jgi:hypothetical protein
VSKQYVTVRGQTYSCGADVSHGTGSHLRHPWQVSADTLPTSTAVWLSRLLTYRKGYASKKAKFNAEYMQVASPSTALAQKQTTV